MNFNVKYEYRLSYVKYYNVKYEYSPTCLSVMFSVDQLKNLTIFSIDCLKITTKLEIFKSHCN